MIEFLLGEEKYITATIVPKRENDKVIVVEATYELIDKDKEVVDSGNCEIDGRELTILLAPERAGFYKLKVSTRVGAERIIKTCDIKVKKE